MRRTVAIVTVSLALVAAPGAANAKPPNAGCPQGFRLESVDVLGDYTGVADNVNHDGLICLRDLSSGGGIFVDNTMP